MLNDKIRIETLPITKAFLREKRCIEDRGELVLLSDGEEVRHITYFSLNPGKLFFRGGHYHRNKVETLYVISGKLRVYIIDVHTKEKNIIEVLSGQKITVYPYCAHKFNAISESHVIEYYATAYDINDDYKHSIFPGE